jgi:hypothetical protein
MFSAFRITVLAAALAMPAAASANVLVDATFDDNAFNLHVQFVTAARNDAFNTESFLLETTNFPGVTVTDFSYSLLFQRLVHRRGPRR